MKTYNGAQLSDSIISCRVDVGFSSENINKLVLHDCSVGIESVARESHAAHDGIPIEFIRVM